MTAEERDPAAPEAAQATGRADGCFLCGQPFGPDTGGPIEAGEGIELCISCGAIYASPGGCC